MTAPLHPLDVPADRAWLRRFSKLVCLATLLLIFFGGQVKSHDAGLSVPDWPLTYGQNPITYPISQWTGGIFHEHFHRLFAGTVAALTVVLAVWLTIAERRRWMKVLGWLAVLSVLLQAVLGGLTVWYNLPVAVSSSHAILAQTFFLITCIIAYGLSREYKRRGAAVTFALGAAIDLDEDDDQGAAIGGDEKGRVGYIDMPPVEAVLTPGIRVFNRTVLLIALIYVQLFLGALMRHTEAGLAIPDFPATAGRILPVFNQDTLQWVNDWRFEHAYYRGVDLPPVTITQMLIHFAHRLGALAVTAAVIWVFLTARSCRQGGPQVYKTALLLLGVVLLQFTLGAFTVWTVKLPLLTSLHVMTGAALLGVAVILALRALPLEGELLHEEGIAFASLDPAST
ncbi:MAG: COX15/CtaA family protein [Candidatus Hydrogenedentes bacterium]|nr:COX15/CtaA family protein [Candidatus Hydrogenedentota bacterium]MBI3118819.1 COX15/CtaA family protein [Candidatus Hydrogenedentota bacterium]